MLLENETMSWKEIRECITMAKICLKVWSKWVQMQPHNKIERDRRQNAPNYFAKVNINVERSFVQLLDYIINVLLTYLPVCFLSNFLSPFKHLFILSVEIHSNALFTISTNKNGKHCDNKRIWHQKKNNTDENIC